MTNAEKYQEVFGFPPDTGNCPTECCKFCPVNCSADFGRESTFEWWNKEYEGNDTVKVEVTEVHTFAKPEEVNNIDFPNSSSENK